MKRVASFNPSGRALPPTITWTDPVRGNPYGRLIKGGWGGGSQVNLQNPIGRIAVGRISRLYGLTIVLLSVCSLTIVLLRDAGPCHAAEIINYFLILPEIGPGFSLRAFSLTIVLLSASALTIVFLRDV